MRMGTVLYLTDAASIDADFDEERAVARLGFSTDWTVVAASDPGYYSVHDATRLLIERGAKGIEAVRGKLGREGDIEIFGDVMRVFG